jgi:perosamine synthetase
MNFFVHDAGREEAQALYDAVMAGDLTTGNQLERFREALAEEFGFLHAEFCNSGTSALHLALAALDIGPGDEVITTPYTGVWTANPILMVGARPVFADIDRSTYNLDPAAVARCVTRDTKAVLPVSVNGVPCDLKGLRAALPGHVRIVCDDIEALGAMRGDKFVGADIGGDVSIHGFWVSKTVTTCSGGMATSEDLRFLQKFQQLSRHGHGQIGDMWNLRFGWNFAFPDPLAAMGVAQIKRWRLKQKRLRAVRSMLDEHFGKLVLQRPIDGHTPCDFVYLIELPIRGDKREYAEKMAQHGVPTRPYFNSLLDAPHLRPFVSDCPLATDLARRTIALPFHWKLTQEEVEQIAHAHRRVLGELM